MPSERILFITGRLAEPALRRVVAALSREVGFEYDVAVLGISVAALMHPDWVLRKLSVDARYDRAILPGWCRGDLQPLCERFRMPFELGPQDLHDLPEYFGQAGRKPVPLDRYDIEILAEINHAPHLSDEEVLQQAAHYRDSGADVIDLGCVPGQSWRRAGDVTRMLRDHGFRVAVDSFERAEVEAAVAGGAELVLSCNRSNLDWAAGLNAELVAIPDHPHDLDSLARTIDELERRSSRFRIDPILEPIAFGFAASLSRYFEARRRWPNAEMLMGIGNLTELTEVDSAGVNLLLAGICQELGIRSVLTTEVINWARSAVAEFAFARRLVYHSLHQRVLPKHLDGGRGLVLLRDPKVRELGEAELAQLASRLTDPNFRIFVERGELHVMNRDGYWRGTDPYELFDRLLRESGPVDASHAFYLGYECAKAVTALTLGKQYTQDQALSWGILTVPEVSAQDRRRQKRAPRTEPPQLIADDEEE
jgi:dihydropteroate synthase-like protein